MTGVGGPAQETAHASFPGCCFIKFNWRKNVGTISSISMIQLPDSNRVPLSPIRPPQWITPKKDRKSGEKGKRKRVKRDRNRMRDVLTGFH